MDVQEIFFEKSEFCPDAVQTLFFIYIFIGFRIKFSSFLQTIQVKFKKFATFAYIHAIQIKRAMKTNFFEKEFLMISCNDFSSKLSNKQMVLVQNKYSPLHGTACQFIARSSCYNFIFNLYERDV